MAKTILLLTRDRIWALRWGLGAILLIFLMRGFIRHSASLGMAGLLNDLSAISPFYAADMPLVTILMFVHMVGGAALVVLAPLQLLGGLRRRWPAAHRWGGRVMVALGLIVGFGGCVYAIAHGTTGGRFMDASSTVYGLLVVTAAAQTYRLARARQWAAHRRWGLRFSVLVIASWLYRMHYVIWEPLTGGLGVTEDMTGPFDKFQAWAFYLSYLLLLEIWFWRESRKRRGARGRRAHRARAGGAPVGAQL